HEFKDNVLPLSACQVTVHKRCHDKFLAKCPGSVKESQATLYLRERFKMDVPHRFRVHNLHEPYFLRPLRLSALRTLQAGAQVPT
ncbi:hypothetical protein MTO96_044397, partial [Rhipicephalus appendiculatus]